MAGVAHQHDDGPAADPEGDMSDGGINEQEVALVLRRAAELDLSLGGPGPGLDVATVEESAVEAGLSRPSVQRALAELRMGALQGTGEVARPRRLLGRATVTVRRTVPGPDAQVKALLRAKARGRSRPSGPLGGPNAAVTHH